MYEAVKAAQLTLEKTPDNPAANLVLGKYFSFVKGDWAKGVPMLALGKDEDFSALAKQDLEERRELIIERAGEVGRQLVGLGREARSLATGQGEAGDSGTGGSLVSAGFAGIVGDDEG